MADPLILDDYMANNGSLKQAFVDVLMAPYNNKIVANNPQTLPIGDVLKIKSTTTVLGALDVTISSENYQQNDTPIIIQSSVSFLGGLTVHVPGGAVVNQFVIQVGDSVSLDWLKLYATSQRIGSGIWTNGNNLSIGRLEVTNVDTPIVITNQDTIGGTGTAVSSSTSNVGFFYCKNYLRAMTYNNHIKATLGGYSIISPDTSYDNTKGHNAFLIGGMQDSVIGPGSGGNSGEHFMRFCGLSSNNVTIGDMVINSTGLAVVKLNAGVLYDRVSNLHFGLIKGTDVGMSTGRNEATLARFSHCDNVTVGRIEGHKTSSGARCLYGVQGNDWSNVSIGSLSCPDFANAISFDSQYDIGQDGVGGGSNVNSYGPVLNSYIKLESGSATNAALIQLSVPAYNSTDPNSSPDSGVSGLTVELAGAALMAGQDIINLGETKLDGSVTIAPLPGQASPTRTAALGGGVTITGKFSGVGGPSVTYSATQPAADVQASYARINVALAGEANPLSQRWRTASAKEPSYEQLCAIELALDRWARLGYIGGSSPKFTGFTVFATVGPERRRINILVGDPALPSASTLFPWQKVSGSTPSTDYVGTNVLQNAQTVASLFPSNAGFIGVYVNGGATGSTLYAFGQSGTDAPSDRFRLLPRGSANKVTFLLGTTSPPPGGTNIPSTDASGFWGAAWDSTSWEISRNGVSLASGSQSGVSMPATSFMLGQNGSYTTTRLTGLMVYGPQKLAITDVAMIYPDVQRIMDAATAAAGS